MRKIIEISNSGASRIKRIKQTIFFAREKFDSIEIGLPANSVWGGDGTYNNIYGYNFDLNYELEFDSNSFIVEKKVYNKHPEIEPDDFKIITYKYNDCGQIMEIDNGKLKRLFKYNNENVLIESKDFNGDGYLITKDNYRYDKNQRIYKVFTCDSKGEEVFTKTYEYFNEGFYYLQLEYQDNPEKKNMHFIYNILNQLIVRGQQEYRFCDIYDIQKFLNSNSKTNYRHDDNGNIKYIYSGLWESGKEIHDGIIIYEYDAIGNWIKAIHYRNSVAYLVKLREITYF